MATQPLLIKLLKQQEKLSAQIEAAKNAERANVRQRILQAIHAYGFGKGDLFHGDKPHPVDATAVISEAELHEEVHPNQHTARKYAPGKYRPAESLAKYPPGKYRSLSGRKVWNGKGWVPGWLGQAVRGGTPATDMIIGEDGMTPHERRKAHRKGNGAAEPAKKKEKPVQKRSVRFRDPETGQTWTGQGSMAGWLKAKVDAGEDKEQYRIAT